MNKSETISKLAVALAKAQAEFPAILKTSKNYTNSYAPLDGIIDTVRPILARHELSFLQLPGRSEFEGQVVLTGMLVHSSGEYVEETMNMAVPQVGKANPAQCYGAGLTYARRYQLEAMLGIAATEDTDGAVEQQVQRTNGRQSEPAQTMTDKQRKQLHAVGSSLYGDEWNAKRKQFSAAFGVESSSDWTVDQANKIISGMQNKLNEMAMAQEPLFEGK